MSERRRSTKGVTGIALAFAAVSLALAGAPAGAVAPAGPELLPDLRPLKPYDVSVEPESGERKRIRFTSQVANLGAGPLEVHPVAGLDCDHDGQTDDDRVVRQRIYHDANADSAFERGTDTGFEAHRVGCVVFHPQHSHWHFERFAGYRLKRERTGRTVASAQKVSFCITDTKQVNDSLPGAPDNSYYDSCSATEQQGISVGWSDIYSSYLEGQALRIDGLPDGVYCLIHTADPQNLLRESNEHDNVRRIRIWLHGFTADPSTKPCS